MTNDHFFYIVNMSSSISLSFLYQIIREVIKNQIEILDPAVLTKISPTKIKTEPCDEAKDDINDNERFAIFF